MTSSSPPSLGSWRLVAAAVTAVVAGCGGPSTPPPTEPVEVRDSGHRQAPPDDGEEDDDVEIVSTQGKLDPEVVTRALSPRAGEVEACYVQNVGKRRWLGGGVEVRWDVDLDGTLTAVRLVRSDLGAWEVEKCVLAIARQLDLGKPRGGKAHVSAPLAFSNGSGAALWDEDQAVRAVGGRFKELGECAKAAAAPEPVNVTVTLYVGTRGKVQSVGFASPQGFADAWADCAHGRAMAWALPDPRGKVAKLSFVYNPVAVEDEE